MKPHLTTSASPLTKSVRGRVARAASRSQSTPAGAWNAPTRFLPSAVLMPVLPPTAASTMPSRVVGTWTTRTPRSQVAATKPARSVVAPPPTPDDRVAAGEAGLAQRRPAARGDLGGLGVLAVRHLEQRRPRSPAARSSSRAPLGARGRSAGGWTTATRCDAGRRAAPAARRAASVPIDDVVRRRPSAPPPTAIRVGRASCAAPPTLATTGVDDVVGRPAVGGDGHRRDLLVERAAASCMSAQPAGRAGCRAAAAGRGSKPTRDAACGQRRRRGTTTRAAPASSSRVPASSTAPPPEREHAVVLGQRGRRPRPAPASRKPPRPGRRRCRDRLRRRPPRRRRRCRGSPTPERARRARRRRSSCPHPGGPTSTTSGPLTGRTRCVEVAARSCGAVSVTESPPNFSSTASASTSATIASATTPAAGTAQTSLRWLMAFAGLARGHVDRVAARAGRSRSASWRRGPAATSPVLMPPSVPPERPRAATHAVRRWTRSRPGPATRGSGPARSRRRPRRP